MKLSLDSDEVVSDFRFKGCFPPSNASESSFFFDETRESPTGYIIKEAKVAKYNTKSL
jgi:hypothetical protein